MKKINVLFVSSGNSKDFSVAPFIKSQGDSLVFHGVNISYFPINGKGIKGYLKAAKELKEFLLINEIDIIHAHYSLCAIPVILSRTNIPFVISLMGDDAYGTYIGPGKVKLSSRYLTLVTLLIQPFARWIISKSRNIDRFVYRKKRASIIPNGVNINDFYEIKQRKDLKKELNLCDEKANILFLGDISNPRKNFELVKKSSAAIPNINIVAPYPVKHAEIVKLFNACDVFLMPAFMEGSPNVIKEAMACNCPIVATNVGDVEWILGNTDGCYIADFSVDSFSIALKKAIDFSKNGKRTEGRERIISLGIDTETTAKKIIDIYKNILYK